MKAIDVITHLMKVLNLTPNKDLQSGSTQHISAYGSFPVGNGLCLIRVADHNTFLYNWIDKNQNIDLTTSANYAITFVDEIPFHSNPNKENNVNAINPPDVIVRQYVYNITALSDDEVTHVMDECIKLAQTGVFTDPLEEDDVKHAIIYRHRTNQPTVDMTSKTRKSHRKKKSAQNKITTSQATQTTENNKTDKNESKNMNRKNTIRLTESELKKVITESVKNILKENDIENRVTSLKNMSKTYMGDEMGNKTKLDKTWNRGMGRQSFIEILPEEGVILYNTLLTNKRDIERIKQVFPEYKVVPVDKPYHSLSSLKTHRQNTLGENRVIKENYNPVHEGIMNFHSDMNALRSDIDEIIEGLYDTNARERLRLMDKKLAQIGAEFAKIESTLNFLGNQN